MFINKRFTVCSNFIDSLDSVSFLFLCPKLDYLVLKGNPISYMHDYRNFIFRQVQNYSKLLRYTMKYSAGFCPS